MKIAVIGSRSIAEIDIARYISIDATEIISGGARGVDGVAKMYAENKGLKYVEFIPQYSKYGRAAPLIRNKQIVDAADFVHIFGDGRSKGTKFVIDYCERTGKNYVVVNINLDS